MRYKTLERLDRLDKRLRILEKRAFRKKYYEASDLDSELDNAAAELLKGYKSFDDELDDEANAILKNDMHKNLDDELDDISNDMAKGHVRFKYSTIDDWLADYLFKGKFDKRNHVTLAQALDLIREDLDDLGVGASRFGLDKTNELQGEIEEISDMSSIRANYRLVKALKAKEKEVKYDLDRCRYDFSVEVDKLCDKIRKFITPKWHEVICKQDRDDGFAEVSIVDRDNKVPYLRYVIKMNTGDEFKESYPYYADERKEKRWSAWINSLDELVDRIEDDVMTCVDGISLGMKFKKKIKDLTAYIYNYCGVDANTEGVMVDYYDDRDPCACRLWIGPKKNLKYNQDIQYNIKYRKSDYGNYNITRDYPLRKYKDNNFIYMNLTDFADEIITSDVKDYHSK